MGEYVPTAGLKPLVVLDTAGAIVSVGRISDKGLRKSLEQKELWWIHPESVRVLPYTDGEFVSIHDRELWAEAVVRIPANSEGPEVSVKIDDSTIGTPGSDTLETGAVETPNNDTGESTLDELAALIKSRNRERPTGSYTSYLFEQGLDKIRKKTGEEAIELVLANTHEEIVYEAADLIYHLLVLFEAEGIPLDKLIDELSNRRS
jgi:phosphoribosyl-AMP cyclohydrolase / phosphoribosyl-ATP pyrophosphohydrolase